MATKKKSIKGSAKTGQPIGKRAKKAPVAKKASALKKKKAATGAAAKKKVTPLRDKKAAVKKPLRKKPPVEDTSMQENPAQDMPVHDQHLIPVKGEMHQMQEQERRQQEALFRHRQEVALHSEQQKIKNAAGANRLMSRKFLKGRNS